MQQINTSMLSLKRPAPSFPANTLMYRRFMLAKNNFNRLPAHQNNKNQIATQETTQKEK
jgi:hypothetical protein